MSSLVHCRTFSLMPRPMLPLPLPASSVDAAQHECHSSSITTIGCTKSSCVTANILNSASIAGPSSSPLSDLSPAPMMRSSTVVARLPEPAPCSSLSSGSTASSQPFPHDRTSCAVIFSVIGSSPHSVARMYAADGGHCEPGFSLSYTCFLIPATSSSSVTASSFPIIDSSMHVAREWARPRMRVVTKSRCSACVSTGLRKRTCSGSHGSSSTTSARGIVIASTSTPSHSCSSFCCTSALLTPFPVSCL